MMSGNEHGTLRHTIDKAQDVLGGMVGRAKAQTAGAHSAAEFVKNAAMGDMYEREAGNIALLRSRSPKVKQAARQMILDHTTSTHQLSSALRMNETQGLPSPPRELDTRHRTMLDHLEAAPEEEFDKTYLDQQVLAHKETHDLLTGFVSSGDNAQLRSLAQGTAPVIARHLTMMETLRQQV